MIKYSMFCKKIYMYDERRESQTLITIDEFFERLLCEPISFPFKVTSVYFRKELVTLIDDD